MRRAAELSTWRAAVLLAAAWALPLAAQEADAPRAPRIIGTPGAPSVTQPVTPPAETPAPDVSVLSLRPPSATRLAPLPDERADIEEIVILGQGWRLPDLGSEWRARQEEAASTGRFSATLLPLYDPSRPTLRTENLLASREERRHGYIELFRLRFGRRARN